MSQTNDMVPVKMVNRDGASVVVKPKLGAKVKLDDAERQCPNCTAEMREMGCHCYQS